MRTLKATRRRQQARRLSREIFARDDDELVPVLARAEAAGLSAAEVREVLLAARRDRVPPERALEVVLDRRAAAASALAGGALPVALGEGDDDRVVGRAVRTDRPAGLHLGRCDAVVLERPGRRPLVVLRPRELVDVARYEAAADAGEVSFEVAPGPDGDRATALLAADACDLTVDPARLKGDPTRAAELLDEQLAAIARDAAALPLREVMLDPVEAFAPGRVGLVVPPPADHPEAEAEFVPLDPNELERRALHDITHTVPTSLGYGYGPDPDKLTIDPEKIKP